MSTDGLDPIRRVYSVPADGEKPDSLDSNETPESQYAEQNLLSSTKSLLDAWPRQAPPASSVEKVKDAAFAHLLEPMLSAYGKAEAVPPESGDPNFVEYELLRTTIAALDGIPPQFADEEDVAAVKAMAAAHVLAPVRKVYGEDTEGVAIVAGTPLHAEYELLKTTKEAVDGLPKSRPDASVLRAISAAAVQGAPALRVASDRSAKRSRTSLIPRLALAASLVIVAVSGVWMLQQGGQQTAEEIAQANPERPSSATPPLEQDTFADNDPRGEAEAGLSQATSPPVETRERQEAFRGGPNPAVSPERDFSPAASRSDAFLGESAGSAQEVQLAGAVATDELADTNLPVATVSEWEAGEDVRLLSLRLQQLANSSEGLDWDESPTPFGAAEQDAGAAENSGIRAVNAGQPVRGNVQVRSNRQNN
ncbi:MAG: hypothetical protein R3284_08450 [Rubricoccaceae bacterium]|nr:hypothetical protein [Rubricoccaceae bacterium]